MALRASKLSSIIAEKIGVNKRGSFISKVLVSVSIIAFKASNFSLSIAKKIGVTPC